MIDIRKHGAESGGTASCTEAIQAAIESCAAGGGGTVLIPSGRWLTGSLFLKSGVELRLESGAVLLGSRNFADYPLIESRWEGRTRTAHAPLIGAEGAKGVSLTGRGTVDGRGDLWWNAVRDGSLDFPRPRLVAFSGCSDVLIEGLTLMNSPAWTVNPVSCENVRVHGVSIFNPPESPNTDGINPDSCRNVIISDCHVSVGDDCITLKSGIESEEPERRAPCRGILISNCILERGHGGVVIGSEMSGGVADVAIVNCLFRGTDRGIRLKSRRGRGGIVENIRASNLVMTDVGCPLAINLFYHCGGAKGDKAVSDRGPRPVDSGTPRFRSIGVSGLTATGVKFAAGFAWGLPESPIRDLRLSDVVVAMDPDWMEPGQVEMADDLEPMANRGFFARNVDGLDLDRVRIDGCRSPALDIDGSVRAARREKSGPYRHSGPSAFIRG